MDHLVDQLFVFEGEGVIRLFNGNYTDYRDWLDEQEDFVNRKVEKVAEQKTQSQPEKKKLSFKEKQEYDRLQQEIEILEKQKAEITGLLSGGSTDHQQLQKWAEQVEALTSAVEEKTMRWLELAELVDQ
jgi:ATP-binding cassette subfamily F protein uup